MDTLGIYSLYILMTTAAVDQGQFGFMFGTLDCTVAINTTESAMNRFFIFALIDV